MPYCFSQIVVIIKACAAVGLLAFIVCLSSVPSFIRQSLMAMSTSSSVILTFFTSMLMGRRRDSEGLACVGKALDIGCRQADVIAARK